MIGNEERREVARKLRKRHGQRAYDFTGQCMSLQLETMANDIMDCIPRGGNTLLTLADLIEPNTATSSDNASTCDREALLRLANRIEANANEAIYYGMAMEPAEVAEYAHRIREAVGA